MHLRNSYSSSTLFCPQVSSGKSTERIALWDNVKFFLMITVVLGHFVEPYTENSNFYKALFLYFYSFHMPLFIFISGLFHKNENIPQKVMGLGAIYVANKILIYLTFFFATGKASFSLFTESGLPWFMFVLAIYTLVTYLLRNVNSVFLFFFFVVTACFAGYDNEIGDFLMLSRTLVYYPFYLLGTLIKREELENLAQQNRFKILGAIILLVAAIIFYFKLDSLYILRHIFTGRNPYKEAIRNIGFLLRILAYLIAGILGFAFILLSPSGQLALVTKYGSRTLQIYFWHITVRRILSFFDIDKFFFSFGKIGKLSWLLVAVGITYLCSLKIFQFPTLYLQRLPYSVTKDHCK